MNYLAKLLKDPMTRNVLRYFPVLRKHRVLSLERSVCRNFSQKTVETNEAEDRPVKYSASPAAKFKARSSLKHENDRLWYEPGVIIASLSIFLIYFLVLREENDLDEEIYMPFDQRIAHIEEDQLRSVVEHSTNSEEMVSALRRLEEINSKDLKE
ncbi:uncharacterized protein LOC123672916 [Harmonia axyridis]|uniref:uncharacterized protein LOC123672916 n=1 Tax=Harmonia axyridis TaxID=115357 RepID=UPI001E277443|nr:uncharacterized protein LOC123672916 [Harmonia axyridis]